MASPLSVVDRRAVAPTLQLRARLGGTAIVAGRQELRARGHEASDCERHPCPDQHGSNEPPTASTHKSRHDAVQKAQQRQRHVHPGRALGARHRWEGGEAWLELHTRRMLGKRDSERRSGKERGAQRGDANTCSTVYGSLGT